MTVSKTFFNNTNKGRVGQLIKTYHGRSGSNNEASSITPCNGNPHKTVQIWKTSCIVTSPLASAATTDISGQTTASKRFLVNPCNPELTGCSRFPYFPRGGPVPAQPVSTSVHRDWQPLGYVSQWGGMEVGTGMLYPVSVIDGLVHQLGGWKLQAEIKWLQCRCKKDQPPCPIGTAVVTTAGGSTSPLLRQHYDSVIHTTPPFYKYDANPEIQLRKCYESVFAILQKECQTHSVLAAIPLLGAGARGFPPSIAVEVAASFISDWLQNNDEAEIPYPIIIAFGLLELDLTNAFCTALTNDGV